MCSYLYWKHVHKYTHIYLYKHSLYAHYLRMYMHICTLLCQRHYNIYIYIHPVSIYTVRLPIYHTYSHPSEAACQSASYIYGDIWGTLPFLNCFCCLATVSLASRCHDDVWTIMVMCCWCLLDLDSFSSLRKKNLLWRIHHVGIGNYLTVCKSYLMYLPNLKLKRW